MINVLRTGQWEATRSVWLWPGIILVSAITVILFSLADVDSPLRAAIGFWFMLICPGMALVRFLRLKDPVNELVLAIAVSIGLGATVATAMAITRSWSPEWALMILAYISIVGATLQLTTADELVRSRAATAVRLVQIRHRMRLYFALMIAAFVLAAISGAALAWDGSYHFVKALDTRQTFIPHSRLITYPMHTLTIFVSQYVENFSILRAVFGLAYAVVPLGSLALCWWIVRRKAPSLFVWSALGIGLGTLPGQFALMVEATLAVQLFWPVVMIILTRIETQHVPLLFLLSIIMIFTHPFSIPLLATGVLLMIIVGFFDRQARRKMWLLALVFIVLAALAAFRLSQTALSYESERLSLDYIIFSFRNSIRGYSIAALIIAWIVALLIAARPMMFRLRQWVLARAYVSWEFIGLATAGVLFVVWSINPQRGSAVIDYRHWVLAGSLPFFALATLESLRRRRQTARRVRAEWNHRSQIVLGVGVVCLLTLALQSVGWVQITQRLQQTMAQSPTACISASSIEWLDRTPLNHFSLPSYSLALQGRTPEKIVLSGDACTETDMTTGFPLADDWDWQMWEGGWFDLSRLQTGILNEQGTTVASE